jgi:hypothetical protein
MRTIALEEHYATGAFMEGRGRRLKEQAEAARVHPKVAPGKPGSWSGCATSARAGSRRWRRRAWTCRCCR